MTPPRTTLPATIVAAYGRHYDAVLESGTVLHCFPRGKKSTFACGDRVRIEQSSPDQGVIVELVERKSLLFRRDAWREKLIAANATQVVVVVATEPSFSDELISRCTAAAESQHMRVVIVLNKIDIVARLDEAHAQLAPFARIGYPVIELCARDGADPLRAELSGHTSVLIGQSGMGKSTLINALVPEARAATREHSEVLDSGKHTTTFTCRYALGDDSFVIDSPGMQVFGLAQLSTGWLEDAFVEFRPLLGQCRFRDCRHEAEPGCAVVAAVATGLIDPRRLAHFRTLRAELTAIDALNPST